MSIIIIEDKCKGCKLCIKACPFDAITMKGKIAVIDYDKCTSCAACISSCHFKAIENDDVSTEIKDLSQYKGVWIFAEQRDGNLMPVVIELLGEGKKLAKEIGTELSAVLVGDNIASLADELIKYGANKVYLIQDKNLEKFTTDGYTKVISEAIDEFKPEIMLMGATHIGRDLAPRVAARVNTGLTADCTSLEIDPEDKKVRQTRPAFGGNLMATIVCPNHRPQMSTVRLGVMEKAKEDLNNVGEIVKIDPNITEGDIRTKVIETIKSEKEVVPLIDANFIVSGGLGLGKAEGFDLLRELADKLDGIIAGSRACVDLGWIDQSYQVGQTGTTVKPNIYIACGISGAIQHVAGMSSSDVIIAINKNENAPIFEVADYGIVGDLYDVIPAIIEALNNGDSLLETLKV